MHVLCVCFDFSSHVLNTIVIVHEFPEISILYASYAIDTVDIRLIHIFVCKYNIRVFFINFWWFQNFQLRSQRTKHLIKWISLHHEIKKVPRIPTNVPYFHAYINMAVGICNRFQGMMKYAVDSNIVKLNCYRISMQKFLTFQQHTHLFSFWVLSAMQWIWPYLIHHFDIQNKRSTKRRKKKLAQSWLFLEILCWYQMLLRLRVHLVAHVFVIYQSSHSVF